MPNNESQINQKIMIILKKKFCLVVIYLKQ